MAKPKPSPPREDRWLAGTSSFDLLPLLRKQVPVKDSPPAIRKLRLFFVACCRLLKELPFEATFWKAIDLAERDADGAAMSVELAFLKKDIDEMHRAAAVGVGPDASPDTRRAAHLNLWAALTAREALARRVPVAKAERVPAWVANATTQALTGIDTPFDHPVKTEVQLKTANLLRDIFGNPFRPVKVQKRWVTANVAALARTIYDERAFDRLPILADALMDAGCDDEAVLAHCRSAGPHARGCWVVDLLLGEGL